LCRAEEVGVKRKKPESGKRPATTGGGEETIPVVEEEATVNKRVVQTGTVRVRKIIREREEIVDEQLLERTVGIERIPINRFVDEPVPVRQEEGTIIVPVMEEVVVVEKRLLLKEEVHIRTAEQSVGKPQKIILRSEEVEIERSERPDDSKGYKH
jgi:uncharacterized protein (TIGR02271 family)